MNVEGFLLKSLIFDYRMGTQHFELLLLDYDFRVIVEFDLTTQSES